MGRAAPRVAEGVHAGLRDGIIRRDFEYEAWLVVLEVDGVLGHEGEYVAKERSRDRRAAGTGSVTLRAGWVDAEEAPCELAVDVHAALRARGYRGSLRVCGRRLSEGGARTGAWPSRPFTRVPSHSCAPAT